MGQSTPVQEIMTSSVTTLSHDATLLDAVLCMRQSGLRHLPVVKKQALVGVLSDRDVTRAAPSPFGKLSEEKYNEIFKTTPIESVMTREPVTPRTLTPPCATWSTPCVSTKSAPCPSSVETTHSLGL